MEDRGTCQGEIYLHVYVRERERVRFIVMEEYIHLDVSLSERKSWRNIYMVPVHVNLNVLEREREG